MTQKTTPLTLKINQVADLFQVSRATIRKLCAEGILPTVRLGKVIRIPAAAVNDLIRGVAQLDESLPDGAVAPGTKRRQ